MEDVDNRLEFEQLLSLLTYKEQQWLLLKLAGFKQNELASILNCSISTLKNYQKRIQRKYSKFYNNA
ncbi:MAG TPA: LuxR C-terminal-related transcriptional regulator [Staphylococcus sp.]|nr:LuxR C-terminal-related transcriptional regulator [Staphylococcus sp.]